MPYVGKELLLLPAFECVPSQPRLLPIFIGSAYEKLTFSSKTTVFCQLPVLMCICGTAGHCRKGKEGTQDPRWTVKFTAVSRDRRNFAAYLGFKMRGFSIRFPRSDFSLSGK